MIFSFPITLTRFMNLARRFEKTDRSPRRRWFWEKFPEGGAPTGPDGPIPESRHEMDSPRAAVSKLQGKTERRLPPATMAYPSSCLPGHFPRPAPFFPSPYRPESPIWPSSSPPIGPGVFAGPSSALAKGGDGISRSVAHLLRNRHPNIPRASDTSGPTTIHLLRGYRTAKYSFRSLVENTLSSLLPASLRSLGLTCFLLFLRFRPRYTDSSHSKTLILGTDVPESHCGSCNIVRAAISHYRKVFWSQVVCRITG